MVFFIIFQIREEYSNLELKNQNIYDKANSYYSRIFRSL